jgi:methylthioribose-1-phosphate isomerase
VKNLTSLSLKYENYRLYILNQKLLPHKEIWEEILSPEDMIMAIQELKVRGAPLIGVAASLALANYSILCEKVGTGYTAYITALDNLRSARPTAVNLMQAMERMRFSKPEYSVENVFKMAVEIFEEDVQLCQNIAKIGAELIEDGDGILTHCNTGGLATVGIGTALGILREAFESGKKIHVFVDETRPLLQGGRLTTWELKKLGIPHTLICDNMAASLLATGKVQKVFVGADRIALNGDFANKVGTYNLAIACKYHDVPFYCAAPMTTTDFNCKSGKNIPIEMRTDREVLGVESAMGNLQWAPEGTHVWNPSFDVTPSELVTGWVLDKGFFKEAKWG